MKWIILDLGSFELKALKVQIESNRIQVLQAASFPSRPEYFKGLGLPEPTLWSAITIGLNEVEMLQADEEAFVTAILPSVYLESRYLKFPFRSEKQIEKVLQFELEAVLPFDIEDVLTRHRVLEGEGLSSSRKETTVLTFSYKRDFIKSFEAELRKFQLSSPPMTAEILALSGLRQGITETGLIGLLEVGHKKTQFVILQKSGAVLFSRVFSWGGERLTQQLASDSSLDFADAEKLLHNFEGNDRQKDIAVSIERALQAFSVDFRQSLKSLGGQGIQLPDDFPIYCWGRPLQLKGLLAQLEVLLSKDFSVVFRDYPVSSLLSKGISGAEALDEPQKYFSALAMGMSQLRNARGKIPLFSESGFQFQQNLKKLKSSSFSLLRRVAMLLIIPFVYSVFQFIIQERENRVVVRELNSSLERVGVQVGDSDSTEDILKRLKKERAANRVKLDQLLEDSQSPLMILSQISNRIPASVKIDVKDFKVTDSLISLSAQTTSTDAAEQIRKSLEGLDGPIKMGTVEDCKDAKDCKTFSLEITREKDS